MSDWDDWDDFLISGKDGGSKKYSLTERGKQNADSGIGGWRGEILAHIADHQPVSAEDISNDLDLDVSDTNRRLDSLKKQGLISTNNDDY